MKPYFYQRAIKIVLYFLAGAGTLGAVLGHLDDAISLITPFIAGIGTAFLSLFWLLTQILLRYHPIPWVVGDQEVKLTKLGIMPTAFVVGMVAILWAPSVIHRFKPPVMVTPTSLDIISGYGQRRAGFKVYNTRNSPYYDVWVQLSLELSGINAKDVLIVEPEPAIKSYSFLKDGDSLPAGMRGSDSSGNPAIWAIMWELPPNGMREYVVELQKGVTLTESSKLRVSASVVYFGDSPTTSVEVINGRVNVHWIDRAYSANQMIIDFKGSIPPHLMENTDNSNISK